MFLFFQNLTIILKIIQQFFLCTCELERTTLNYNRKALKQKYVSELHIANKLVQSAALLSATPLKTVMFVAKDESMISKEFTIKFRK